MGSVITLAQQKGGSGKTTLLAHLAHAFSDKNQEIALLDLDPQASLTAWAGLAEFDNMTLLETASYRIGGDIRSARDRFDYVFVDCPGSASSVLEAAIRESDLILIPCQPSKLDLWASKPVADMCKKEGKAARILLNRVPPRGGDADAVSEALAKEVAKPLKVRIGNRVAFSQSFGAGKTALAMPGKTKAKDEIAALKREVARVLKAAD